jgi:hypothetical protein
MEPIDLNNELVAEIIEWEELKYFYARGQVIEVSNNLSIIEVANQLIKNNIKIIETWILESSLKKVEDQTALDWFENKASVRSIVVRPWILVQLVKE